MHALSVLAPKKFPIVCIYFFKMQIFPTEPVWNCDEDIFFHSTFLWWCSFQGLFTYKWQWQTKSSSTVVQGSIKRKPSSNIASFARDLNEDNVNWMSIVPIFVLVFTSSLYMLRAIQVYVAWSEGWNWSITSSIAGDFSRVGIIGGGYGDVVLVPRDVW